MASQANPLLAIARTDQYNGVVLSLTKQDVDIAQFEITLPQAIEQWHTQQKRGITIIIPIGLSELIPVAVRNEFKFHHAQPEYVQMNRWLPLDQPNLLPGYATHYIGVGGFVVNDKGEVLVVKERYQVHKGFKSRWKFPGGHAVAGESLIDAGLREVLEETGVKCEFRSLLSFRHTFHYRFGCDYIYYVIWYNAISTEISADPHEISECKWIPVAEYVAMPEGEAAGLNRFVAECYLRVVKSGGGIGLIRMPHPVSGKEDVHSYAIIDTDLGEKHKL